MESSRQLKTKIRAVGNIKQITKAMQMVSATKMRRSQEVALNARPYAKKSFSLLAHLLKQSNKEELESIFWRERQGNKIALVVITSDKGLAGSFNSSVLRRAAQAKEELENEGFVDIVAVGKKGRDFFKRRDAVIAAEFLQFSDIIMFADVRPLADWILQAYEKREYDKIVVCSNQFVSALVQKVKVQQILPLNVEELERAVESIVPKTGKYSELLARHSLGEGGAQEEESTKDLSYVLEPSREEIVRTLVRNLIQVEIAHFVFESNASEHSARMMAMKNATENAEDLMETLNLELNRTRQASITQELSEISTAKEALTSE